MIVGYGSTIVFARRYEHWSDGLRHGDGRGCTEKHI